MKQFTRALMLAANDYQAQHDEEPKVRFVYVSFEFHTKLRKLGFVDYYQGYNVMVVLNENHPDYLIYLR